MYSKTAQITTVHKASYNLASFSLYPNFRRAHVNKYYKLSSCWDGKMNDPKRIDQHGSCKAMPWIAIPFTVQTLIIYTKFYISKNKSVILHATKKSLIFESIRKRIVTILQITFTFYFTLERSVKFLSNKNT